MEDLPKRNQTGANEWKDVEDNDLFLKGQIERAEEEMPPALGKWYTPKIIAEEESRANAAFSTLTTPDQVTGVVLPAGGLIGVHFHAQVKVSSEGAGFMAIFLGENQLKEFSGESNAGGLNAATSFRYANFTPQGTPASQGELGPPVDTGQAVSSSGGPVLIKAAAGTYTVSVRFRASTGSITAKNRELRVFVLGD